MNSGVLRRSTSICSVLSRALFAVAVRFIFWLLMQSCRVGGYQALAAAAAAATAALRFQVQRSRSKRFKLRLIVRTTGHLEHISADSGTTGQCPLCICIIQPFWICMVNQQGSSICP